MKEYKIGEVFRHTDGKAYQCVEGETCEGCAFRCTGNDCVGPYCDGGSDGRSVKFIAVTEPAEGMLYRAGDGRMYRLAKEKHWQHTCVCDDGSSLSCAALDCAVFGGCLSWEWYWAPVEEDAPASDESSKPVESPKRHIELAVVKVEGDKVTFKIADQTHRNDEFSQQVNSDEFKSSNGLCLLSHSVPEWLPYASALYCRGKGKAQDLCEITCTTIEFAKICEAVAEYNATDGKGREPRWPQEGDKYFCIAVDGELDRLTFDRSESDRKLQDFGNFFRTKEEAEAALERVKQVLKK